ncbi:MAG: MATE family efflux transporter [Alphaproteobacteria bacterium]|nr:MATE family efflux transporter [Alphaproteobacteria bacterium]MBV9372414.1 MATE family efflux transporter [Alphaproteobacteria bacterium]MBV9902033.1 MATE family efflux transporter [Alphaproteobacteria bacterium]
MLQRSDKESRLWREEIRATTALAWPLILTNLTQSLIQSTDVLLLGWAGSAVLAAGTLGINLYYAFLIFGIGLVIAAAPMIARELGARRHSVRDVRRTVRQTMWAAVAIVVPVWVVLWHSEAILLAMHQEPALAAGAGRFVRALMWGMLPALWYLVLRSFVSALEKPVWSLIVGAAGVAFNAVLNYSLIFGKLGFPPLGLRGAGIGSTCANSFMFVAMALVVSFHPRFRRYRLFGRFWRADGERFAAVWRLGLPIAVTLALEITIFNAAVFLMGLIGAASLAAHAVALQIAAFSFMVPLGVSQAVTVRVGLAFGRGDPAGIARAGWTAFVIGVGFMALMAMVMLAIPHRLVGLFLDPADPANAPVISLAVSFLFVAALFQIFDGAQSVGAGMLRGLHDTKTPMLFAAFGYWGVGLVTAVGLGFGLGWNGFGIWVGLATGLAVVSALMLGRWVRRERLGLLGG